MVDSFYATYQMRSPSPQVLPSHTFPQYFGELVCPGNWADVSALFYSFIFLRWASHCVAQAQAGLEILCSNPPVSVFPVAGTKEVCITLLVFEILFCVSWISNDMEYL